MKQFIITEQEKYNILKQYGLFEQNKTYPYLRPGDKYYAPPTGPFAPPPTEDEWKLSGMPTKEDWEDWLITMYEPKIKIPIPILGEIKMSAIDIISIFSNIIPYIGPYVSIALDASSTAYFVSKGNNYEAGLRALFMIIPGLQLPIVQKFGKEKLIKLLAKVENLKGDVNLASNLSKEEMKDIVYLFRYFRQNKQPIKSLLSKSANIIISLGRISKIMSEMRVAQFMGAMYRLYKINPEHHLFTKGSKVLLNIFTQFGVSFGMFKGWDYFWNKYASEYQKLKKKEYDRVGEKTSNEIISEIISLGEEALLIEKSTKELKDVFQQNYNNTLNNK